MLEASEQRPAQTWEHADSDTPTLTAYKSLRSFNRRFWTPPNGNDSFLTHYHQQRYNPLTANSAFMDYLRIVEKVGQLVAEATQNVEAETVNRIRGDCCLSSWPLVLAFAFRVLPQTKGTNGAVGLVGSSEFPTSVVRAVSMSAYVESLGLYSMQLTVETSEGFTLFLKHMVDCFDPGRDALGTTVRYLIATSEWMAMKPASELYIQQFSTLARPVFKQGSVN